MADIDIVRKERSNLWLWIVLAVVVLLALYFLFGMGGTDVQNGAIPQHGPLAESLATALPVLLG